VLSYNILAQSLLESNRNLYRCPREATAWPWRCQNLLAEILHYSPSVACLQEVEEAHLPDLLGPLRAAGYEHRFKRRVGDGQTDGCATFWRTREWDLVSAQ
jgi:RNA exonuclease NGL2